MRDEPEAGAAVTDPIRIANEFAVVLVRRVCTGAGYRLELQSERNDQRVQLDATVLEALCGLGPAELSALAAGDDAVDPARLPT
jgi:hypothetical protein